MKTVVRVERVISHATPAMLFKALACEELLEQWFYPVQRGFSVRVNFSANPGNSYRIDMIDPDGKVYTHTGIIREVIPEKKMVFTWNSHVVQDTLVSIGLEPVGRGTRIMVTHSFHAEDEEEGHEEGWKELIGNLTIC